MKKVLPNIILIVCDTLGAKHMSLYGYDRRTTPNLERLVEKEGFTIYQRCFAPAPWTSPSHASLFTGLYPSEHGTNGLKFFLDEKFYTLPEILTLTGYSTIGFSNNYIVSRPFGYEKGFGEFYEIPNLITNENFTELQKLILFKKSKWEKIKALLGGRGETDSRKIIKFLITRFYLKFRPVTVNSTPFTKKTVKLAEKKIAELQERREKFFLFINLMQTHGKYNPPKGFRKLFQPSDYKEKRSFRDCFVQNYCGEHSAIVSKSIDYWKARYDEEIFFLDTVLHSFYTSLKERGFLDNTLFIITSDHGELFGEMGHLEHAFITYNSLVHIPLLVRYPEAAPAVDDRMVQLHDIFALICDMIDSPIPVPENSISPLSLEKRKLVISQSIDMRHKLKFILRRCREWDFKRHNFSHSNMSAIMELDNILYKTIYYSTDNWEFYKLRGSLYEENNNIQHIGERETIKLKKTMKKLIDDCEFCSAVPENEYDLDSVFDI
jgi:arylsulfatase A-like enzyme